MRVQPIRTTRVGIQFGNGRKPATATAMFFSPPLPWTTGSEPSFCLSLCVRLYSASSPQRCSYSFKG